MVAALGRRSVTVIGKFAALGLGGMMTYNLFVGYELSDDEKANSVARAIESLGAAYRIRGTLWYVKSEHTCSVAARVIRKAMDQDDSLIVIDGAHAAWYKLNDGAAEFIKQHFLSQSLEKVW